MLHQRMGVRLAANCESCDTLTPMADLREGLCAPCRDEARAADLQAIGDLMQSEVSRLLAWAKEARESVEMGYEAQMAVAALEGAIDDWSEARSRKVQP